MSHIFISYKSQERKEFAFPLRDHLRSWGYEPWLDEDDLRNRDNWMTEIDIALKSAAAVVAVVSPSAIHSRFVTSEWDIASMRGIPLVLLEHRPTKFYRKYADVHRIDFTGDDKADGYEQLRIYLDEVLAKSRAPISVAHGDYLEDLYDRLNSEARERTITSLATYGAEGQRAAEPLRLQARLEQDMTIYDDVGQILHDLSGDVLLLGEPGSGKSMTFLNWIRDAIVDCMHDPTAPIPITAKIDTWDPDEQTPIVDWLAGLHNTPESTRKLINGNNTLLLLDALDELGSERPVSPDNPEGETYDPRQRFLDALNDLPDHTRIIVSCRVDDYETIATDKRFEIKLTLLPLNDSQIADYLYSQPELFQIVQSDQNLRDWLDTPLLLSFFAFAYEGMSTAEKKQFEELSSPGDFRDRIMADYVERRYQHEEMRSNFSLPYDLQTISTILGEIATGNLPNNLINIDDLAPIPRGQVDDFIEQSCKLHILIREHTDGVRFAHMMLMHHFAYAHCWKQLQGSQEDAGAVMKAVGYLADKRVLAHLLRASRWPFLRGEYGYEIAFSLGQYKDSRVVDALVYLMDQADNSAKVQAIRSLNQLRQAGVQIDVDLIEPLCDLLNHAEGHSKIGAIEVLTQLGEDGIDALVRELAIDRKHGMHAQIATYLAVREHPAGKKAIQAWEEWKNSH